MGSNWKRLADTRGKMVEEYQEVIIPRYRMMVNELQREIKRLKDEMVDARYRHDQQADFAVGQGRMIDELKSEINSLHSLLELARTERDLFQRRMMDMEIERTTK